MTRTPEKRSLIGESVLLDQPVVKVLLTVRSIVDVAVVLSRVSTR